MQEIWKDIIGYEGQYQISNTGKVKRLERLTTDSLNRKKLVKEKIFLQKPANNGYTRISFGMKREYTHRLVAIHFIPNPDNKPEVNHIDGNKENNHVSNLEWVTKLENCRHASETGLINKTSEKRNKQAAINGKNGAYKQMKKVLQFDKNGNFIAEYESIKIAGEKNNIPYQNIGENCNGKRKSAGGYIWKFKNNNER